MHWHWVIQLRHSLKLLILQSGKLVSVRPVVISNPNEQSSNILSARNYDVTTQFWYAKKHIWLSYDQLKICKHTAIYLKYNDRRYYSKVSIKAVDSGHVVIMVCSLSGKQTTVLCLISYIDLVLRGMRHVVVFVRYKRDYSICCAAGACLCDRGFYWCERRSSWV